MPRPTRPVRRDTRPETYVVDAETVWLRRSERRRRTVTARREQGRLVVMAPAGLPAAEERRLVEQLARKVAAKDTRRHAGDADLEERAARLSARYLAGAARPTSVRWSTRQHRRWGSCTPETGEIRISESARDLPDDVFDYVLLHELTHLLVPGHGPDFWAHLQAYPHQERARGFLDGVVHAQERGLTR